ncbi:MAG: hypothetical protein HQK72_04135 [Desulfamplus sp.]|nr:hypothetical protein [Desulfamplus sp.]
MNLIFSDCFVTSLKKYSAIKESVRKKVDMIADAPISLGEPLKGNFQGYYTCSVRCNFLIIFLYCSICRKKGDNLIVLCSDCLDCADDTIKFIDIGPHDKIYGI